LDNSSGTVAVRPATPEQIEGPYWLPGSPRRTRLIAPDVAGARLTLSGQVFGYDLKPIQGAWLDFWQCDGRGIYDVDGHTLRGHQFSDAEGRYRLETVVPVEYTDVLTIRGQRVDVERTAHIHVKVKTLGQPTLTTQLYFPDGPRNAADQIFRPECVLKLGPDRKTAQFDFVLAW
jgi:protocatechuate 3,4-dioxygenase beta subunit